MPNEVTPTQDDHALAEAIVSRVRGFRVTLREGHRGARLAAAHRIAHEAPLLARNAELVDALVQIASDTTDPRARIDIARATLATKDTASHD